MTTSARSVSEAEHALHPAVLQWIHAQGWRTLRPVQTEALGPVLSAAEDVIISAPTAGGKTEAAFLPICSVLARDRDTGRTGPGVAVLYVSPLKALINDQYGRLELMCRPAGIPVHRWHGDVAASAKAQVRRFPEGIVIITPESLEALLMGGGHDLDRLLSGLRFVVIDELHAFLGSERGAQLQSLLHRVELAVGRRLPRIALSATLADPAAARDFLRPGHADRVRYVNPGGHSDVRLRVYGHVHTDPTDDDHGTGDSPDSGDGAASVEQVLSRRLFNTLRGGDHLIFANARGRVEAFADRLSELSRRARVPNEFFAHHGNLAKDVREFVEARLKDPATPTTAVCTSTLEMGIDIGSVQSVAQIGPPPGVASLRQRIGRSGRRGSPPSVRIHVPENAPSPTMSLTSELRTQLVQTVAMVELMGEQWLEPPNLADLHLSTLLQQVLAVVAQNGGASAASLYRVLCKDGPFHRIDTSMFAALLRSMAAADLLSQSADGLLLPGTHGDRLVNHYTFYAVFHTSQEFRVVHGATTLGTLPVERPLRVGSLIIFAGRRWRVLDVDPDKKLIQLTPSSGGKPPLFTAGALQVADTVRKRMRALYRSDHQPPFLDDAAQMLLQQGRDAYTRLQLNDVALIQHGSETVVLPWRGDTVMNTLAVLLQSRGFDVGHEGVLLTVAEATPAELQTLFRELATAPPPDPVELAATVAVKAAHKYDQYLSPDLLAHAYAARSLDIPNTWNALRELAELATPSTTFPRRRSSPTRDRVPTMGKQAQLGRTPFAVLDVETTGFDAAGADRIVEIAIVRLSPDAEPLDRWTTLIDPHRSPGPTHVHGITVDDLRGAPTFAQIADAILARLDGAVVVAHNADYDLRFLHAEFNRLGRSSPEWPSLCTMALSYRLGSAASRGLHNLCAAEGLPHHGQHTALGDAEATASLFGLYLRRARASGARDLTDMDVSSLLLPDSSAHAPAAATVLTKARTTMPSHNLDRPAAPATGNPRLDAYLETVDYVSGDTTTTHDIDAHALRRLAEELDLTPDDIATARHHQPEDQHNLSHSGTR